MAETKQPKTIEAGNEFEEVDIAIDNESQLLSDGNYVAGLKEVIAINSGAPTHTPKKFKDCFYTDGDTGALYIFQNNTWLSLGAQSARGTFDRTVGTGYADLEITTSFAPKLIKITGIYQQDDASMSWGSATSTDNQGCVYTTNDGSTVARSYSTSKISILEQVSGGKYLQTAVSAIGSTSFTLTFTDYNDPSCKFMWEAIG